MLCRKVYIELPFFVFIFAVTFAGYNESECALLGSTHPDNMSAKLEELGETQATVIIMTKTLVGTLGTPIMCFFLGPWSDRYGRKPVLVLTIGGIVLQHLIIAILCEMPNTSPWYILLSIIPLCFTGGFMAILAAVLCYINDITSTADRGLRITIFYGVLTLGSLLGFLTSSYALRALDYFLTYITAFSCLFLSWLIICLFLEESVQDRDTEDRYRNLFKFSLLQDAIKTPFKRRDNYNRLMLLLVILYLMIFVLIDNNSVPIIFLYVREKFQWSLETFTLFNSINTVTSAVGSIIGIYFLHKLLNINETILILLGFVSVICGWLLIGLAKQNWHIFAASINCFYGTINPMSRSLISKLVSSEEYGKIFSFLAVSESVISPLGSPLFTYVYNSTLSTFPGAVFLVAAGFATIGMIFAIIVVLIQRNNPISDHEQALFSRPIH